MKFAQSILVFRSVTLVMRRPASGSVAMKANDLFARRPDRDFHPDSKLEAALHMADTSIAKVLHILEAH
ncbi:MAG TPA: hypothetical protein VFP68_16860 [Burkholderiaceae bacterium]|nr:hypothetical protein [Burkholderiaceae bacterium]